MAVFFRGMTPAEALALTEAMLHSGDVLDLSAIPGAKVDKHSTGGVGDKVSLPLAPLAAACGVKVPMVSGRGLGHTGGTLDKLEAIPGFRVDLPVARFVELVRDVGAGLIGQTAGIAPADRKLYALRDVTATVESIPLIAASIMSKKLAEGIDGLVLDVKVGRGAFMKTLPEARRLAETLVGIGRGAGKRVTALLTAMDQPLGLAVGNALEVAEAIGAAARRRPGRPARGHRGAHRRDGAAGRAAPPTCAAARRAVEAAIADGRGLAAWRAHRGGPGRRPARRSTTRAGCRAPPRGWRWPRPPPAWSRPSTREALGLAAMALGAGRARVEDRVDPAVGLVLRKKVGDRVERGEPLLRGPPQPGRRAAAAGGGAGAGRLPHRPGAGAPPPLVLERMAEP